MKRTQANATKNNWLFYIVTKLHKYIQFDIIWNKHRLMLFHFGGLCDKITPVYSIWYNMKQTQVNDTKETQVNRIW